ncbi:hypothetical protein ACHAPJ_009286 [Fusarium lateritium]
MSSPSDYYTDCSVDSNSALEKIELIIENLRRNPVDPDAPNIRFGHLTVPVYLSSRYHMVHELTKGVRKAKFSCPIIFISSRTEERIVHTDRVDSLGLLHKYNCQTLQYSWFLDILKDNRAVFDNGPGAWKPSQNPDEWFEQLILPIEAFFVFSLDPYLPADCSLALIGLVQWACDVSLREGAKIRVLTTSRYLESNLLSDLVGIRSECPVAHYELPIPTGFKLIHEECIDNAKEDEIVPRICHRLETGAANEKHAVIFVPPYTGKEMLDAHRAGMATYDLCNKSMLNDGNTILEALQYQSNSEGDDGGGAIINVDVDHLIPSPLIDYTHVHIVIAKEYMGRVFDEESSQVVLTNLALTQGQQEALKWWCSQPNTDFKNIWIYPGPDGLEPEEDVAVDHPVRIENAQAGGFIAAVYAMSKWGVDVRRVLRCFIKSPWIIPEMANRLHYQGIIQQTDPQYALTGSRECVFEAILPLVRYDHRLAYFIALISPDVEVRRLKVQLATFLLLKDDWNILTSRKKFDLPTRVESWGWGKSLDSHGDLWRMLGLWKRISRDCHDFEDLEPACFF